MAEPPVLLLHGLATSANRTWRETGWIDLLHDMGRIVLAPDLLGHGAAPQPTDPAAYAGFEAHIVDSLPDEPVDAIGFSLGARTLLILAAAHPGRFRRLVVAGVGANLFRHDGGSLALAEALDGDGEQAEHPMVRHFTQLAASSGQRAGALAALLRRPDSPSVTVEMLSGIAHPVLVVLGDRDFAGPAAPLVEALPNARFVELRRVDHFGTPKAMGFLDAALTFLE